MHVEGQGAVDHFHAGLDCSKKGDTARAIEHLEQASADFERQGADGFRLSEALLELARSYALEERMREAEKAFEKALAIREAALAPDDPKLLDAWREVAMFHHIGERFDRAEALYRKLLSAREKQCQASLDMAGTLASLAELYADQGGFNKAVEVLSRALSIEEQLLGREHTSVGQTYSDLADCYAALGKFIEAEAFERSAFQIFRKVLGPDHNKTTGCLKRTLDLQEKLRRQDALTKVDVEWQG